MPDEDKKKPPKNFEILIRTNTTKRDQQIEELQERLEHERDARKEDRFVGVVLIIILLNVVFFTVIPTFTGPIALLVLELIILVPLAKKMGMEQIVKLLNRVLDRITVNINNKD